MIIEKGASYNNVNKAVIERHVAHMKTLDDNGNLMLCGPLTGYSGVAGMVILQAQSFEEADSFCKVEPLVTEGYATYKLSTLQVANKENDYLLHRTADHH